MPVFPFELNPQHQEQRRQAKSHHRVSPREEQRLLPLKLFAAVNEADVGAAQRVAVVILARTVLFERNRIQQFAQTRDLGKGVQESIERHRHRRGRVQEHRAQAQHHRQVSQLVAHSHHDSQHHTSGGAKQDRQGDAADHAGLGGNFTETEGGPTYRGPGADQDTAKETQIDARTLPRGDRADVSRDRGSGTHVSRPGRDYRHPHGGVGAFRCGESQQESHNQREEGLDRRTHVVQDVRHRQQRGRALAQPLVAQDVGLADALG